MWEILSDYRNNVVKELIASITKNLKIISKASDSFNIEKYYPYIEFHYLSYLNLDLKDNKKLVSEKQELYGSLLSVIKHNIESGVIASHQQGKVFIDKVREIVKKLNNSFDDNDKNLIKARKLVFGDKVVLFDYPISSDDTSPNFIIEDAYTKNLSEKLSDIPDAILSDKSITLQFDICECGSDEGSVVRNYKSYTRAKNKIMILYNLFSRIEMILNQSEIVKVALRTKSGLLLIREMLKEIDTFNSVIKPTEIDPFDVNLKHFLEQLEENTASLLNTENNN